MVYLGFGRFRGNCGLFGWLGLFGLPLDRGGVTGLKSSYIGKIKNIKSSYFNIPNDYTV